MAQQARKTEMSVLELIQRYAGRLVYAPLIQSELFKVKRTFHHIEVCHLIPL